jgi:PAT family beta-lactamase induction signal transducer AmpG
MITGQGGLVMLAGIITMTLGPEQIEVDLSPTKSITIKENNNIQEKVIKLKEFNQLTAENKEAIRSIGLDTNNKTFALFKYPLEHKHLDFFTPKYSISNKNKELSKKIAINFTTLNKMELVIISVPTTLTLEKLIHLNIYPNNLVFSWSVIFLTLAILFLLLFNYHNYSLPKPQNNEDIIHPTFKECFISFFKKEKVGVAILFLLTFRLGESQLVKLAQPFMLDSQAKGGLELPLSNVGFIYGTVGTIALILGGIIGGILVAKYGLRKLFFIMALSMNIPNILYWVMAYYQPQDTYLINVFVALEQFGYGFGFTAFTLFMVDFVDDSERFRASHFAIMTGFMALGMMLPMMLSGYIQSLIGYQHFFLWVMLLTIPGFFIIKHIPIKRN